MEYLSIGQTTVSKCTGLVFSKLMHLDVQHLFSGKGRSTKIYVGKKNFSITQLFICFQGKTNGI